MMAGRNISASHVAFTSTRVMATCAVDGPGGRHGGGPVRPLRHPARASCTRTRSSCKELQQTLLRDDQTIKGLKNEDPADLARKAKVTASAEHEGAAADHVLNGWVRDEPGQFDNRWAAPLGPDGAWIELAWDEAGDDRRACRSPSTAPER